MVGAGLGERAHCSRSSRSASMVTRATSKISCGGIALVRVSMMAFRKAAAQPARPCPAYRFIFVKPGQP